MTGVISKMKNCYFSTIHIQNAYPQKRHGIYSNTFFKPK